MKIGLIGRTNVGKSTLFNKLIGNHRAIVTDICGTTRELLHETIEYAGYQHELIDSPGLENFEHEKPFLDHIIQESDILLFLVDGRRERGQHDMTIKKMIIDAGKKSNTLLIVNKLDGKVYDDEVYSLLSDWYAWGFDNILPISAQQVEGIERIREYIREQQQERVKAGLDPNLGSSKKSSYADSNNSYQHRDMKNEHGEQFAIPLAIIGKPNAGKSTLLNTLTGEWIAHVSEIPGTTLDYLSGDISFKGTDFIVYDTAGIKKKGKTAGLEKIAYTKTISLLNFKKPVVILLVDLMEGITKRDASLFGEVIEMGLPVVLAFNKIDQFTPNQKDLKVAQLLAKNTFLKGIPSVDISGKEALGLNILMNKVQKIYNKWSERIPTHTLNKVLTKAWLMAPPRFPKNKICKWKYITQVDICPPTFNLSVNNKEYANFSFKKRVQNVISKEFDLDGVPLRLTFTSKVDDNPYTD